MTVSGARGVESFELRLPDGWHAVPAQGSAQAPGPEEWARSTALGLVDLGQDDPRAVDTVEVLAEQLADVAAAAAASGVRGLVTAALVARPATGVVDAMVTLVAQQGIGPDSFRAQLSELVAEPGDGPGYVFAGEVVGDIDAGAVVGLHTVQGHMDDSLGVGVDAHLEERVSLGVFPPGCPDMVEVTAIARSVGTFEDMPQAVLDLLAGLTVTVETA